MNAVVKPTETETIFDYNLSETEHTLLAHGVSKNEYLAQSSQQRITMALAALFGMRGNKEKQQLYIDKLDSDFVKTEINWDLVTH